MTTVRLAVWVLLLTSARPAFAQAPVCVAGPPSDGVVFHERDVAALAGAFVISMIDTTTHDRSRSPTSYDLVLWPNDSVRRAGYVGQIGRQEGTRPLGGTIRAPEASFAEHRAWTSPDNRPWGVVYLAGRLQVGTIDAFDGWRNIFEVEWRHPTGFVGRWTSDAGISVVVDSLGNQLPNPAGYFCAERVPGFPDAPRPPS